MASSVPRIVPLNNDDLNNATATRPTREILLGLAYSGRALAISSTDNDPEIWGAYRPFLLDDETAKNRENTHRLLILPYKINTLILLPCLRNLALAFEAARILFRLGCDVRIFNPEGLPVKDDLQHNHPKVQELRSLSTWSDGHVWVSPEQHGNLTAVFKNQIDWIPLGTGSVRPTQGRILAIAQVCGGSQSFNTVNALRILGRWMRISLPKAYTQFTDENAAEGGSRIIPSGNRDRLVDCMEEFVKLTIIFRPHFDLFADRFS
ncbi:flavoprotein-like protein [Lipomyces starkeyi]